MRRITNLIVSTGNILLKEAGRLFRPHGITAAQYNVLNLLGAAPDGLRQRELAAAMVVDPSSTTYAVDSLEGMGYVRRREDKADRRAWRVVLTVRGRGKLARVTPLYEAALRHVTEAIGAAEIELLEKTLSGIKLAASGAVDTALEAGPQGRIRGAGKP